MIVTTKAIYKNGKLIFSDSEKIPEDGTEIVIHFENKIKPNVISQKSRKRGSLKGIWKGNVINESLFVEARKSLFSYEDE